MSEKNERPRLNQSFANNALAVVENGDRLATPDLEEKLHEVMHLEAELWDQFLAAETGSVEEFALGEELAQLNLLKTSQKIHSDFSDGGMRPGEASVWRERFTDSSAEIYGAADGNEATKLVAQEMGRFETVESDDPDIQFFLEKYHSITGDREVDSNSKSVEMLITPEQQAEVHDALRVIHKEAFALIENLEDRPYTMAEAREVTNKLLTELAKEQPIWNEWEAANPPDKSGLSVSATEKEVRLPDARVDFENKAQMIGLLIHEVGVHAKRSVEGQVIGDEDLQLGMPLYGEFEEGLGVLSEYMASGIMSTKHIDRYVDIAIASGAIEGQTLSREDMITMVLGREKVRAMLAGKELDEEQLIKAKKVATTNINRIFRGSDGMAERDSKGEITAQAVYAKDIIYYGGFLKVQNYIKQHLEEGQSAVDVLNYLLSGKFDATVESHNARVLQVS